MAWVYLLIAGILEIVWAIGLKYTNGFTRVAPSLLTVVAMVLSMALLSLAVRTLPIGTAYAAWTGIGILGTTLFGILLLQEPVTILRLGCIALIVIGITGLKLLPPGGFSSGSRLEKHYIVPDHDSAAAAILSEDAKPPSRSD